MKTSSKTHFLALLAGIVAGVSLMIVFNTAWTRSSSNESCMSCHAHPESDASWKQSYHYNNGSGTMTECAACHLPPKGTVKYAAAKAKIEGEIAEIHKMDESIGSLEDLMQAPYWPELYAMTKRGYSIKDAHFLLNHDRLEKAKIDAAKQQTMNNTRGKDHMTATAAPRGAGSISVPAADLAMFRQFNPGATDAEIQAYYNKYKKG